MRNKTRKQRASAKLRDDHRLASMPGEIWGMGFMADQLFNGPRQNRETLD